MTQRIFDVENEKDMQDLWDILPDEIEKIRKAKNSYELDVLYVKDGGLFSSLLKINWHDKTEIIRPIQEATEQDIGKLCYFWEEGEEDRDLGILVNIGDGDRPYRLDNRLADFAYSDELWYDHARRLTKQEIEEII